MKFSRRAATRALLLLPVLATVSWLAWEIARPRTESRAASGVMDTTARADADGAKGGFTEGAGRDTVADAAVRGDTSADANGAESGFAEGAVTDGAPKLFEFDPNTVPYHDLVRLGFTRGEALGIVKYRERGKVFEIAEDFAACYQVSEAAYLRLAPYIRIAERFRLKPFAPRGGTARDGSATDGAGGTNTGGDTGTAAAQDTEHGANGANGSEQGAGAAQNADRTAPPRMMSASPPRPALVDLNTADSAALIAVRGIGPRTVVAIVEYRARLGGFARVEQLAEVRGVTEQNYALMLEQIYVDPAVIQKIDINFAPAKRLAAHPYIRAEALRKLLKQRQIKGGWRTAPELEQEHIFTADELARLGPYLDFK